MITGPLDLLIIQGTPFCNIDCKYCYLPDRLSTKKISLETVKTALIRIFESGIVQKDFSVVWHAGEPLIMPIPFYDAVTDLISASNSTNFKVRQTIQTNGILLNQAWCDFIKTNGVNIGISIDGPEFIHDMQRVDRNRRGTHQKVMEGVRLLKANDIPFYVIAVVTEHTLDYPDEFFHFFLDAGVKRLCFNLEEAEGLNRASSLTHAKLDERFKTFIRRLYQLYSKHKDVMSVREFNQIEKLILKGSLAGGLSQQTVPFRILNVDTDGNFSTFSPELLGMNGGKYGDFHLGNFATHSIDDAVASMKLSEVYKDIISGIISCKKSCGYFSVCGGGTPSNKFSENGTFNSTETSFCRFKNQTMFNVVLSEMESTTAS